MKISVIIPTYNESDNIVQLLKHLKEFSHNPDNLEIIVADKSEDNTLEMARNQGVRIVECQKKGRGAQMNEGAAHATGEILYFLHCDSYPPVNWDQHIQHYVAEGHLSGCFQMRFDLDHWFLNLSCWFTRFDYLVCRGGDQSLFITKKLFYEVGGYIETLMEDMDIVKKVRKKTKFGIIPAKLITSARRYKVNGVFYLQYHFAFLHLLRLFGVGKEKQLKYYKKNIR